MIVSNGFKKIMFLLVPVVAMNFSAIAVDSHNSAMKMGNMTTQLIFGWAALSVGAFVAEKSVKFYAQKRFCNSQREMVLCEKVAKVFRAISRISIFPLAGGVAFIGMIAFPAYMIVVSQIKCNSELHKMHHTKEKNVLL